MNNEERRVKNEERRVKSKKPLQQSYRILHSSLFVLPLKPTRFQPQSPVFRHTKHNVHILHRLSHSTL